MSNPPARTNLTRQRLTVTGVVQGVGFRPFVYSLAIELGLTGWVYNTSAGVTIEVEGPIEVIQEFSRRLVEKAPPLAQIEAVGAEILDLEGGASFEIIASRSDPEAFQPISPDISICNDCLSEISDPTNRRYRYPFTNCTNCGPRFTIIQDIPYDRPSTTMAAFAMCPQCLHEYNDPLDRRFHAQPVACPTCGPQVWLEFSDMFVVSGGHRSRGEAAIQSVLRLLEEGKIIAIKGLGGFHLACDATNEVAVSELRRRKGRVDKPFALMMADLEMVERYCSVEGVERSLLESRQRPIVLLWRKETAERPLAASIAPHQSTLGVMLPYTPLHYLLFPEDKATPLVMTSGNYSEEPIATDNKEVMVRLATMADAFLLHNRDIHIRTDDSVVRVFQGQELPIRRSRGYAPYPVRMPFELKPLLAVGGELKNTFCLGRDQYAFLSQHVGDMENYETLSSFEASVEHFERLFRTKPEAIAYDLHPDYMATRYALARAERDGIPAIGVQHHHAHIAACLAENADQGKEPVIGVAFDGTGYGLDGTIWGGEFLIADYQGFERAMHLVNLPLPGGDAGTNKPARVALSYLLSAGVALASRLPPVEALAAQEFKVVERQVRTGLNTPMTSSMGRLFDAVASIAGVRQEVNYEGQAAIELEALADASESRVYPFDLGHDMIDMLPLIRAVAADYLDGMSPSVISARFHNSIAAMILEVCLRLRQDYGLKRVALSGGVFQNVTLLRKSLSYLRTAEFKVLIHRLVPPNDGGIALGQAVVASRVNII